MNEHNFDSNRSEQVPGGKPSEDSFDVYSKQYTPGENGYTEQNQRYSASSAPSDHERTRRRSRRSNHRVLAVVAITVGVILLCTAVASVVAGMVFSYYGELYEEMLEEREASDSEAPESQSGIVTDPADESEIDPPAESEMIFSSDEETEIKRSESTAVVVDGQIGDADLSMADVAALVADSVVEITTSETLRNGLVYKSGAGSGVIINQSGVILTNNHVIEGGTNVSVRLTNGSTYEATLVATDATSDIAILKIAPKETLTVAVFGDSDKMVVGEQVLAIGNPLGILGGTVTNGIVSALGREVTIDGETMTLLQHNAAISPGNSGGALFNMRGELIGIVNAKYSSSEAEGLGFAIPVNTVLEVYDDLIQFGYVKGRADHGLTIVTDRYYIFQGYLYIYSSRYTDELQYGDRLLAIDGKTPTSIDEAYALLGRYEIGDEVEIVVVRNSKQISVSLEIREYTPQN